MVLRIGNIFVKNLLPPGIGIPPLPPRKIQNAFKLTELTNRFRQENKRAEADEEDIVKYIYIYTDLYILYSITRRLDKIQNTDL